MLLVRRLFLRQRRWAAITVALLLAVSALLMSPFSLADAADGTGSITGTITDTAGQPFPEPNNPVAYLYLASNPEDILDFADADDDGVYTFTNLAAGQYKVSFDGPAPQVPEWWQNVSRAASATIITVGSGAVTGISGTLATGGASVTGKTVDANGNPLAGICVYIDDPDGPVFKEAQSKADGSFAATHVSAGPILVEFEDCTEANDTATEYYNNQTLRSQATTVNVTGTTVSIGPITLDRESTITGTVTGPSGTPAAGICVAAFGPGEEAYAGTQTESNGTYELSALGPVATKVKATECDNPSGNFDWWNNAQSYATATTLALTAGSSFTGIDFSLGAAPVTPTPTPAPSPTSAPAPAGPSAACTSARAAVTAATAELASANTADDKAEKKVKTAKKKFKKIKANDDSTAKQIAKAKKSVKSAKKKESKANDVVDDAQTDLSTANSAVATSC